MPYRKPLFSAVLLVFASVFCGAQTATCTNWTFFNSFSPSGINRFGTVVGSAQQSTSTIVGYIRYSNGATKTYIAPNAGGPTNWTLLTRRNSNAVTVGWYRDVNQNSHGLVLSGVSTLTLDYPGSTETILYGINYWGAIVGIYNYGDFSTSYDGFKLKNGVFTTLHYPGAFVTNPTSISNQGIIVGWYHMHGLPEHGFLLANGIYQTLDDPNGDHTFLNDINGYGVVVGTYFNSSTGIKRGFIYTNGTFKDVKVPNFQNSTVEGINRYGYVTGTAFGPSGSTSFIAKCQ